MKKPKIILWDIETSNLNANFGFILCIGWKYYGAKKVNLIKISDYKDAFKKDCTNDYHVVKEAKKVLEQADGWVTHYGQRFDEPYLNSRLLYHGLSPLPPMGRAHIDTWRIMRYKMKLNSNRLNSATAFFNLEEKTPVSGPMWIKAIAGDKKALKYVYEHCKQDIVVLEQAYDKLKPLHTTHFNINLATGVKDACPRCGEVGFLQKRGFQYAATTRKQRYQCQACGGWSTGKSENLHATFR